MRADTDLLQEETADVIQQALLSYDNDVHVTIYVLRRKLEWNELQSILSDTDHESSPSSISSICEDVEAHLESRLRSYLHYTNQD